MWEKIKRITLIILVALGVLFIILMLLPDTEEDYSGDEGYQDVSASQQADTYAEEQPVDGAMEIPAPTKPVDAVETVAEETPTETPKESTGSTVVINIPPSEISSDIVGFRTTTLNNNEVTQDIFSDFDITIVHVWGTFCNPCLEEMDEYAAFYSELPDNVNLVGIVCDVYDGINTNVKDADEILKNAGAEFMNLRTSDSIYDVISGFQYVPSTFFVDAQGHIIGKILDGAGIEETKKRYESYTR